LRFTGQEVFFDRDDLIVSKTDKQGRITYANHTFLEVAGYQEDDVIGKQHNVIRHPAMPRAIFDLLWSSLQAGEELFAYVANATKNGDHYWVIAHVTPSFSGGQIIGYHSTRRVPNTRTIKDIIIPLYSKLNAIESRNPSKRAGLQESLAALTETMNEKGITYDEFMAQLCKDD
jgi:PAS domain S-box-containing protein